MGMCEGAMKESELGASMLACDLMTTSCLDHCCSGVPFSSTQLPSQNDFYCGNVHIFMFSSKRMNPSSCSFSSERFQYLIKLEIARKNAKRITRQNFCRNAVKEQGLRYEIALKFFFDSMQPTWWLIF